MWGVPTIISFGWRVIRYVSFRIQLNVYFLQTKEPWHLQWDIEHGERFFIQGFANPCLNLSAAALMAAEASNPELHVRGLIMLHSHSFSSRLTSRRIVANWNRFSKRVDQGMDINSEKWPKKRDSTFEIVFFVSSQHLFGLDAYRLIWSKNDPAWKLFCHELRPFLYPHHSLRSQFPNSQQKYLQIIWLKEDWIMDTNVYVYTWYILSGYVARIIVHHINIFRFTSFIMHDIEKWRKYTPR